MSGGLKPFTLFPRELKGGRVFYVRYRLPDGTRTGARSTGQTSKRAAEAWAWANVQAGVVARPGVTLGEFTGDSFFSYDGTWALDKRSRGLRLSERTCAEKTAKLKGYILPALGSYRLTSITKRTITDFRNKLFQRELSSDTINKTLDCIRAILEAAEDAELIPAVPKIERASGRAAERGTLTRAEVAELFAVPWGDQRACVVNALAVSTGMRLGECLALHVSDLSKDTVHVHRSYDSVKRTLADMTKTGAERRVTVPQTVLDGMRRIIGMCPHPLEDPFIFWAARTPDHPVDYKLIRRELYAALKKIGISDAQRRARGISFHSHRHFFNSLLVEGRIPAEKVRRVTGHATAKMTAHYYHADDFDDVKKLQADLFRKAGSHE